MIQSWQTTLAGLGCIAGGVYLIAAGKGIAEGGTLILAGLGLLRAKDIGVHSTANEVAQASTEQNQKALDAANGR